MGRHLRARLDGTEYPRGFRVRLQGGDWCSQRLRGRELHNGIKGADNSAQTLEMGEKDEALGNLCSPPAPLSWTLRKRGPYLLLPGSSPGGAGRALNGLLNE